MERTQMSRLRAWKVKPGRKPLIIRGARQVGKTWLMKEFGRSCYARIAYFNFDENQDLHPLFSESLSPDKLLFGLKTISGVEIEPESTLIIFDEIQECPRALTSLKYFCEEAPEYSIVAAGSLLGVAMHRGTSFPVGKVEYMDLHPLSFREFLTAMGEEKMVQVLQEQDWTLISALRGKYAELLRIYYLVGGMPEAADHFIRSRNMNEVRQIQKSILDYYQQDFSKHAETMLVPRLNLVWNAIPGQLAKENRKFIYGQVRQGARAKDFELALQWMEDCGLIHKVFRVSKPGLPLKAYMEMDAFKVYMHDVGLLAAMADVPVQSVLYGNQVFTEFKGALTEQYVLQQLVAEFNAGLYYYAAENGRAEVDFLLQSPNGVIPLEVKAEENLQAKSLRVYHEKYHPETCVRSSMSDYREHDWMVNIPLYALSCMDLGGD